MFFLETHKEKIIKRFGENIYNRAADVIPVYIKKWRLENLELINHFSGALLFACVCEKHGQCVLKLGLFDSMPLEPEIQVLRLFDGRGYCRVYEFSSEDKICLLERIIPGTTIYEYDIEISQSDRIKFFCDLYEQLYAQPIEIPDLSMFVSNLNRLEKSEAAAIKRDDCQDIIPHIKKAKDIILSVNSVNNRKTLIHGDLHHRNMIKNQNGGYTAVDPEGIVDDPVFDVSSFILYEFGTQLAGKPIEDFLKFIDLLSERLTIPAEIMIKCLYAELVIQIIVGAANGNSRDELTGGIWNMEVAEKMMAMRSK